MDESGSVSISLIIPAFNEEDGIGGVLDTLTGNPPDGGVIRATEIIVVDDGSRDGTADVVAGYGDSVNLIRHTRNRGYGAALKTGLRAALHPIVGIADADQTYPTEVIPELVRCLVQDRFHMVVGARTGSNVAIPLIRRPAKWVINRLAALVAGQQIPDLNSGLRVFQAPVALRFFSVLPDGFSFTTTLTLGMLVNGYRLSYLPIDYYPRTGRSKIRPIRDTLNFLQLVLRIALYFAPLKVFLPLSLMFMLLALAWGLYTWLVVGQLADLSTLVLAMTGIQIGVVGLLAELINRRLPNIYQTDWTD